MPPSRPKDRRKTSLETHVGPVLKQLRVRAGISLRTLASIAGFSASFLSQLEKAQVSPSIASLERIARALDVSIVDLLQGASGATDGVVRGKSRVAFTSTWSRARIESLSPDRSSGVEAMAVTIEPSGTSGGTSTARPYDQFAYQLKGTLMLLLGERQIRLRAGDAVILPAGTPHRWQNAGRRSAQVLLVMCRAAEKVPTASSPDS
jgi:transcriptional regulator with XRE-family HTH domain